MPEMKAKEQINIEDKIDEQISSCINFEYDIH
jgi:hypothetical protein